jgi:hypothetical protein
MAKSGRRSVWVVTGIAILVTAAMVPALLGTAGFVSASNVATGSSSPSCAAASPPPPPPVDPPSMDTQNSYGGQGYLNYSFSYNGFAVTYNSSFGWTVTITATQTSYGNWTLEEQRTVGVTILKNVTTPKQSFLYCFHSQESDAAFANITNQSTVYVNDQPVAALGIVNSSAEINGLVSQSLSLTNSTGTYHASLTATAVANASVSFSPSLGLIPLNLSGVSNWNASSTATFGAAWNFSIAFTELNGKSGSFSKAGSLGGTATVVVVGHRFAPSHAFSDHQSRTGVTLFIQGPLNGYDGFILIPRAFDLFGGASHPYDPYGFGSAAVTSESLYVSAAPGGLAITAADQTFGSTDSVGFAPTAGAGITSPAATGDSAPGMTVDGQPISAAQAQSIDRGITSGAGLSGGSAPAGASGHGAGAWLGANLDASPLFLAVVFAVVAATIGTVAVLAWRSSARRP